jgi:hypothetical protein
MLKIWYIYTMRECKGQNIVELVMLVAAVVLVCIMFLRPQAGGPMHDSINAALNSMVSQINNGTSAIQFSN